MATGTYCWCWSNCWEARAAETSFKIPSVMAAGVEGKRAKEGDVRRRIDAKASGSDRGQR